jgi:hypothetical protein
MGHDDSRPLKVASSIAKDLALLEWRAMAEGFQGLVAMPVHLIRGQDEERSPHIVGLTTARLDPRVVRFDQADRGVVIQETVTNAPLDPSKRPNVTLQRYLGGIMEPS